MKLTELEPTIRLLVIKIAGEMAVAKISSGNDYAHHFHQSLDEILKSIDQAGNKE